MPVQATRTRTARHHANNLSIAYPRLGVQYLNTEREPIRMPEFENLAGSPEICHGIRDSDFGRIRPPYGPTIRHYNRRMERKRIDLSGNAGPKKTAESRGQSGGGSSPAEKKKNVILLSVAGVFFLVAGYIVYANFFATPQVTETAPPEVEAVFDQAAKVPPPPEDEKPLPEPGIGKKMSPGG